jgi:hypothetical protein
MAVENQELQHVWDTETNKYKMKTRPDYPDQTTIQQARIERLEKKLQFRAKPLREQIFSKPQIEKILPAIKILHEHRTDWNILRQFLIEFEA